MKTQLWLMPVVRGLVLTVLGLLTFTFGRGATLITVIQFLGAYWLDNGIFDFYNHGWVGEGTSCPNGYFFPKPPVNPGVIVSRHPAFSVMPR